ncbi:ZIP zinc transporter [Nitzschia inconspicua]|uniref:ZIP zinc transporter n=1 Tax=Nitzschia inconspicua TaxID=303405 RepID=A0A9K3KRQ6_9STRA|nr:ZIP zinc transporter [Nitzschia inconspicua]
MNEPGSKLVIAIAIFVISFLSAAAPSKVINIDDQIFSCGNLLASGVLLAGSLVHQLPDSIDNLESLGMDFPLATFVAGLTFCLFLVMEEYLHTTLEHNPFEYNHRHRDHDDSVSFPSDLPVQHEGDNGDAMTKAYDQQEKIEMEIRRLMLEKSRLRDKQQQASVMGTTLNESTTSSHRSRYRPSSFTFVAAQDLSRQSTPGDEMMSHEATALFARPKSASGILAIRKSVRPSVFDTWRRESFDTMHPIHHHDDHLAEHVHGSLLASIILMFALSIHSIFEGLAIGVSPDMSDVISTAAAVLAHKAFAGYALGSSMIASQMNDGHFFMLVFVFSFCSSFGIILGLMCEQLANAGNVGSITGVIQAMVAGTFLYVSIVEIGMKEIMMHRESETPKSGQLSPKNMDFVKLLAFLVGYLCMSSLAIWV